MTVSSGGCTGSDCSNRVLSPAIIGVTTASALLLALILITTLVVVGIAVGIRRQKKKQHMFEIGI